MTDLENKAFAFIQVHTLYDECKSKHYRDKSDFELMAEFAQKQTDNLSKHIIDLQKDKGNLTDRVKELEAQIEKMKCCGNCIHCKYDENEESYEFCEKHQQVVNIAIVPCSEYERR